ncbi:MAG: hypothetical protein WBP59_05125 [Ilumatobacteraceae bacterium]
MTHAPSSELGLPRGCADGALGVHAPPWAIGRFGPLDQHAAVAEHTFRR